MKILVLKFPVEQELKFAVLQHFGSGKTVMAA